MPALRPLAPILLASALTLAACDTSEERAEKHYQSGMELLAEGDTDRALIEFRNVFRLNGMHTVARLQYASILRERGELQEAYGQYLRLAEQDPQNAVAHRDLTELALQIQDFETAEIHVAEAYALTPEDPKVRALKATVDFRKGENRGEAVAMARAVIEETSDSIPAHMIVIANRLNAEDTAGALAHIDTALESVPGDEGLHLARLATLEKMGDTAGIGAQLQDMAALFPDNDGVREALVQWHLLENDPDSAEAILRGIAERDPDNPEPRLTVVQFLYELHGITAAREELERLITEAAAPAPYQRALAELDFAEGRGDEAIAALRGLLDGAEPSDGTRSLQITLAQMLAETGDTEGSTALLTTILEGDRTHVEALKLQARIAIREDRPQAAIQDMRTALGQAPRDPEIMTIMALAHEREGSRELMGERLSLAVEVSNQGIEETLRYAAFLHQEGRPGPAEGVITDALRRAPENRDLLNMLGRIHLERGNWTRAEQIAGALRKLDDPAAAAMADAIKTSSLRGQGRTEDTISLLESLAADGTNFQAMSGLVRAHVEAGNISAAQAYLGGILDGDPENTPAQMLLAGVHIAAGETGSAEGIYRDLIGRQPEIPAPYQALFTLLADQGRIAEAEAILAQGISEVDDNSQLLFTQAGILEARGDAPGAIAHYEELYARDPGSLVVANNLASLLSATGASAEDISRASSIARRLRNSDVPYFKDTYGWIVHLRGDPAQALIYLDPAADALPDNALVQFHAGEAEFALKRWDAAQERYNRALEAAETGSPLPVLAEIEERLRQIETAAAEAVSGDTDQN